MPYIKETCVAGDTVEVSKYYSYRWHIPGERRNPKTNESSDAIKRVNQRQAEKKLRRLMNTNFQKGDLLIRLDFHKENRPPGSEAMQEIMQKTIRKLRSEFKKQGKQLKYIYVKEIGSKGGRHIHILMNKTDMDTIVKAWPYGGIHIDPVWSNEHSKIAAYFVKYALKTEETEGALIGKRWYGSRNLEKPKIRKQIITAKRFKRDVPKAKKGYELINESIRQGICNETGFEYLTYMMIRTDKEGGGG